MNVSTEQKRVGAADDQENGSTAEPARPVPEPTQTSPGFRNPFTERILRRPTYEIPALPGPAGSGTYNLSLCWIVVALSLLVSRGSSFTLMLALILFTNTCLAITLDQEAWRTKVSFAALPGQLRSYVALVIGELVDTWPCFLALFIIYATAGDAWAFLSAGLSPEAAFWITYGTYMAVRLGYLAYSRITLQRRWHSYSSPFVAHSANTRSPSITLRHELWAFFWGNVGLVVRCGKQLAFLGVANLLSAPLAPIIHQIPNAWLAAAVLFPICLYGYGQLALLIYYKVHRTIHENKRLFQGLHKIHHKGVYPSLLDAGTESPAELSLTETPQMSLVFPTWAFAALELVVGAFHCAGHAARHTSFADSVWHLNHHRFFSTNYGAYSVQLDRRFGTACEEPYI
jgi:sterol desaturase/sphingolipid hydroxylase (fatty acid hydroxylase superfamily)